MYILQCVCTCTYHTVYCVYTMCMYMYISYSVLCIYILYTFYTTSMCKSDIHICLFVMLGIYSCTNNILEFVLKLLFNHHIYFSI